MSNIETDDDIPEWRCSLRQLAWNASAIALGVFFGGLLLIGSVALVRGLQASPSQTTEGGAP